MRWTNSLLPMALVVVAFGQTQQPAAPVQDKKVPESAEHKYAQQKFDEATRQCADLLAQYEALESKITEMVLKGPNNVPPAMFRQLEGIAKAHDQIKDGLPTLESRIRHADDCVAVYQKTIDKKVSDLTTRESEQIKACQSEDLYPPDK